MKGGEEDKGKKKRKEWNDKFYDFKKKKSNRKIKSNFEIVSYFW